ncbi:guanitoxin biosynthesis L-enduracididine beta-hydroxylase GntD [Actinomadura sp. 9N215]|uniref:guanitoxin biosynthesis L-enduracididine beta-hydroxylase GntD n=1 Tax=Actinomadura sp. 9N215 TaxID=3375150 RepID=UPI0037B0A5D5
MSDDAAGTVTGTAAGTATIDAEPRRGGLLGFDLSPGDARRLMGLARFCATRFAGVADADFLGRVSLLTHDMPQSVREFAQVARLDARKHAVLISGNDIDDLAIGDTPLRWRDADTERSRPYAFLAMLYGALFGDVIGWATQQNGRLVTDVVPTPGEEHGLVSSCSESPLGWHTEDAFSPYRADYVGLLCLRSPEEVGTTISYVDPEDVPDEVAALLRQPRYVILPDSSHDPDHNSAAGDEVTASAFGRLSEMRSDPPKVAVLSGHPEAPVLRIDRDFVVPAEGDAAAAHALAWLVDHLDAHTYDVALRPGDMCFIDNRNVVHGRRAFRARFDGRDRWLKRVNVVTDLRRTLPGRVSVASRVIG